MSEADFSLLAIGPAEPDPKVVPRPSCPCALSPQHSTEPDASRAHADSHPALILVTPVESPVTSVGVEVTENPLIAPQHQTPPLTLSAQLKSSPVATCFAGGNPRTIFGVAF